MKRSFDRTHSGTTEWSETTARLNKVARSPGFSGRTLLLSAAVGFPASIALLMLSLRSLDRRALHESLHSAKPAALAIAVCASSLVYVAQAARWRLVAQPSPRLPFRRFLDWAVGAIAVNNVVPGRPGDLLRVEWLSRGAKMPRARALASVVVDRGLDLAVLVAAFAFTYPSVGNAHRIDHFGVVALLLVMLAGLVVIGVVAYSRRARRAPGGRLRSFVMNVAAEVCSRLRGWRGVAAVMLSLLAWGLWSASAWLVASSVGIALTPLDLLFVTAVINLGVAIPSSPGFIGTYQWLSVWSLGVLGVNHTSAFVFSILMHAAWFVPTTLAGAVLILRKCPPLLAGLIADRRSQSNVA